jgi:hypothetical protein
MRTLLLSMQKPNWLTLQILQQQVVVELDIGLVLILAGGGFVLPVTAMATTLFTWVAVALAEASLLATLALFSQPLTLAKKQII